MDSEKPKRKYNRKCPKCGEQSVAKILWGLPTFSEEMRKQMEEGKLVLGGCCIITDESGHYDKYHCKSCNHEW